MAKTGPRRIAFGDLNFAPRFAHGDQASVTEATGAADGDRLGAGFARFANAEIPWTVKYDEVLLVLEGHVTILTDVGALEAGPRDCVWLPEGTALTYIAEDALVFYALSPADWAERAT